MVLLLFWILNALCSFFMVAATEHVDVETVYLVEVEEVCDCPTQTLDAWKASLVTSCTVKIQPQQTIQCAGIYALNYSYYPCWSPPCTIEYNAPCTTCHVSPKRDKDMSKSPSTVTFEAFEYFQGQQIANYGLECVYNYQVITEWNTRAFVTPTMFVYNDITVDITVVPTILTYETTYTNNITVTTTLTTSVHPTASQNPVSRNTTPPSSTTSKSIAVSSSIPSISPSATPSSPPITANLFSLYAQLDGQTVGIISMDAKLGYSINQTTASQFYIENSILFTSEEFPISISTGDISAAGGSYLYVGNRTTLSRLRRRGNDPSFSVVDGMLIVEVDGVELQSLSCPGDDFCHVAYPGHGGVCQAAPLRVRFENNTTTSALPSSTWSLPSSTPVSGTSTPTSSAPGVTDIPSSTEISLPASSVESIPASTISDIPSSVPVSDTPSSAPDLTSGPASEPASSVEPPIPT